MTVGLICLKSVWFFLVGDYFTLRFYVILRKMTKCFFIEILPSFSTAINVFDGFYCCRFDRCAESTDELGIECHLLGELGVYERPFRLRLPPPPSYPLRPPVFREQRLPPGGDGR